MNGPFCANAEPMLIKRFSHGQVLMESSRKLKYDPGLCPGALGFRMPAEWERHEATWLAWPHDSETWPAELPEIEGIYFKIIEHLHRGEQIHVLVEDDQMQGDVQQKLAGKEITNNVFLHQVETDSVWIRDYGPMFLVGPSGESAFLDCQFNAWGRKYDAFEKDNRVPEQLVSFLNTRQFQADLVLEGGAVDVNGLGTCLTTEACILNPNRNPSLTRPEMERCLKDLIGARQVIWLERGLTGDDTDGHIDEIARFVAPTTLVATLEWNAQSPDFGLLKRNWEQLCESLDQDGKRLDVVTLPMPEAVQASGARAKHSPGLPASYANFYIGNDAVLVPTFNRRSDQIALGILKDLFPRRKVVGIDSTPLILGLGAMHCITQQQPVALG